MGRLPAQIDDLINKDQQQEKRGLTLCMYLWAELRSSEKLKRALTSQSKITSLNQYREIAEVI